VVDFTHEIIDYFDVYPKLNLKGQEKMPQTEFSTLLNEARNPDYNKSPS
jgi:hypothetical protein